MDIESKVLLLAMLKKEDDESLNDILLKLENSRVFTLKEGKRLLKELKSKGFISEGKLTVAGDLEAKKAEAEFKL